MGLKIIAAKTARFACVWAVFSLPGIAIAEPYETFAGSATCGGAPVTFSILVTRHGPLSLADFDDPCRSGAGRCNDAYRWEFDNTQRANGTAHITSLSELGKFETIRYDLSGTAADIPPPGWNRNQSMRYKYMFVAVDHEQSAGEATEVELAMRRYIDIYDGEEKVSLSLAGAACISTDAIYRRHYPDDLDRETTE
jgi:hypothetical protein